MWANTGAGGQGWTSETLEPYQSAAECILSTDPKPRRHSGREEIVSCARVVCLQCGAQPVVMGCECALRCCDM